ncbi:MAG: threonine ammonia-lyase, biosynthetic [Chromatiales bacterium]|nr:threonine ammonia-lyase, biosynthetic [Chromatiales bacterium]
MGSAYIDRILRARVYDVATETPLELASRLSRRLGARVWFKREDLQPVFSFKLRGAYNKIVSLSAERRKAGVVAASAGNHAQGVALAAQRLGVAATIVMPVTTPSIKVEAVRSYGARVELHGDGYDEAYAHAVAMAQDNGAEFIHPFDDPDVIAGQGTVAMEILRQHPDPIDAVYVPIGGGGLISGVAEFIKYVHPSTRVIGVEPDDAPSMYRALKAKRRVRLSEVGLFADGAAVRQVGAETLKICRRLVDEVVLVSTDEICAAIKDVFEDTRSIAEPAGALSVAGLKKHLGKRADGGNYVAIVSGANINFDRLRHVAERAEVGEQREFLLAVTIPEEPGSFLQFCKILGKRRITEFNYRYSGPQSAQVFVGVEISRSSSERVEMIERLRARGLAVTDMTDNELAKLHIRYMVGGRSDEVRDESIFKLMFPERPGALLQFLSHIGTRWNISLFHYRNHGAAYGRVLIGLQLSTAERREFLAAVREAGYSVDDETENPAYRLFVSTRGESERSDG